MPTGAPMVPLGATLFGQLSLSACAEWLWSGYAVKHPDLKIIMSEGGIGWVAMLHDRLENIVDRSGYGHYFPGDLRPAEILHRNFWFSTIDDPSTLVDARHGRRRPHHVRVRLPARRRHLARHPSGVRRRVRRRSPTTRSRRSRHENAAALFRHPLPPPGQPARGRCASPMRDRGPCSRRTAAYVRFIPLCRSKCCDRRRTISRDVQKYWTSLQGSARRCVPRLWGGHPDALHRG